MRNLRLFAQTTTVVAVVALAIVGLTASMNDGVMTQQKDGTYVVNTTTLAQSVKGFAGPTPLKVYIKKDKVIKVEALTNSETPQYFDKVKKSLLSLWNGMSTTKAETAQIDGATGATYSSKAVKENVRRALIYYKKHK